VRQPLEIAVVWAASLRSFRKEPTEQNLHAIMSLILDVQFAAFTACYEQGATGSYREIPQCDMRDLFINCMAKPLRKGGSGVPPDSP